MLNEDIDILARTLWGEARGEGEAGMQDVACVVMNRAAKGRLYYHLHGKPHPLFGDGSPASACLAPWQFSCWNADDPNLPYLKALTSSSQLFSTALSIAAQAIEGNLRDRTQGATHYRRIGTPASWAVGKTPCFTYLHHEFFNDI